MKLQGWCSVCRKIKWVTVKGFTNATPTGVCDDCSEGS